MSQPKDPLLEAFESQQEAVKADPTDFNKWVSLLSASEKLVCASFPLQGSLSSKLFEFLHSYNPLCWFGLHLLEVALLMTWMQGILPQ